jgi:hypothetical protein
MTTQYVLLCRHGPHRNGSLTCVQDENEVVYPTEVVGARLRDQMETPRPGQEPMRLAQLWCADTPESKASLRRLTAVLGLTIDNSLSRAYDHSGVSIPVRFRSELKPQNAFDSSLDGALVKELRDELADRQGNAVLVVGHQPQLSWIADELLGGQGRRPWRHPPVPIDRAGLVCIQLQDGAWRHDRLAWAISFDDKEEAEKVREKIRLKMETAKLISGALALGLTVIFGVLFDSDQFGRLGDRRWTVQLAAALLLAAAVLYFATMYAYDGLLMPERFWGERRPLRSRRFRRSSRWLVDRPPSSAAWVLYQNMMRVWRNLFTTASFLVGAGITLLGYGALRLSPRLALTVGILVLLVIGFWVWWSRPVLGSED